MTPRADGKRVSAGFAVFLISFLVLTTLIVFAVLLFLSYENMYNNLIIEVNSGTEAAANDVASDIVSITSLQEEPFEYTMNDDGSDNFKNSRIIDKFVNSQTYRSSGSVYMTDIEGQICCRNNFVFDAQDNLATSDEGPLRITQTDVLEMIKNADTTGTDRSTTTDTGRVVKNRHLLIICFKNIFI